MDGMATGRVCQIFVSVQRTGTLACLSFSPIVGDLAKANDLIESRQDTHSCGINKLSTKLCYIEITGLWCCANVEGYHSCRCIMSRGILLRLAISLLHDL